MNNTKKKTDGKCAAGGNGASNIFENKLSCAKQISDIHIKLEETISGVAYITSDSDNDPQEPIKLLEINNAVSASGFFPVTFGPTDTIPYKRTLIELTAKEAEDLENGNLQGWPEDWKIGEWLYRKRKNHKKGK